MIDLLGPVPDKWAELRADIDRLVDQRPIGGYRCGLFDPPWEILMRSKKGYDKSPQRHYECVPTEVLASLRVGYLFGPDAVALMWGTWPMLLLQAGVLAAWGFEYKSGAPWFKGSPNSEGDDCEDEDWNPAFAGGYLFRNCSEPMLLGTRGKPILKPERRSVRGAFFDPQREHSRKPDDQYVKAEALSPGPYIELFSRTDRDGWTSFGNEAGRFNV